MQPFHHRNVKLKSGLNLILKYMDKGKLTVLTVLTIFNIYIFYICMLYMHKWLVGTCAVASLHTSILSYMNLNDNGRRRPKRVAEQV